MNTQPTPETDELWSWFSGNPELLDHVEELSRRLERERDEARAEMIRWQSIAEGRGRTDDDEQLAAVTAQRDRLAEVLRYVLDDTAPYVRQWTIEKANKALQSLTPKT